MISTAPVVQSADLSDARAAAAIAAPLVASAVARYRRGLASVLDPSDDIYGQDETIRRWLSTEAGELRALLDEIGCLIWEADRPADVPFTRPGSGEATPLPHGGECAAVGGPA